MEKARADRLQKKVQFIQDNQDLFNKLKQAYLKLKDAKGNIKLEQQKEIKETGSQTNAIECFKNSKLDITTVSKKDLAEVTQLVQDLKGIVSKGDSNRNNEHRQKLEIENQRLKTELFHKTSELDRLRSSSGSGPREVALLRRVVAKLMLSGNDLSSLSHRESQFTRLVAKKYMQKHSDSEKKIFKDCKEQSEEVLTDDTAAFETPRSLINPETPRNAKEVYSTPRWARAQDVP